MSKKEYEVRIPAITLQFEAKDKKDAIKKAKESLKVLMDKVIMKPENWKEKDAEDEINELKQALRKQVSELKDVISNAPFSESNRRALWIIHDIEKLLKEEK
jgi:HAMP domain-containing protein